MSDAPTDRVILVYEVWPGDSFDSGEWKLCWYHGVYTQGITEEQEDGKYKEVGREMIVDTPWVTYAFDSICPDRCYPLCWWNLPFSNSIPKRH